MLFADDTLVMLDCLGRLGFDVAGRPPAPHAFASRAAAAQSRATSAELFCGNSGTTIRFLTALCALGRGRFTLDGIPRMRQRPIGQLVDLLQEPGRAHRIRCWRDGFPPVEVLADGLPGGLVRFGQSQSSQFLSAVLQVAPYARHEVRVDLERPADELALRRDDDAADGRVRRHAAN